MRLGVGALKVEEPIAQKGSSAFQVTMATKRAPTSRHRSLKEFSGNTYYNPYLPIRGWDEWEQYQQISQAMNSNDPQRSAKQSKADLRDAITYQPLQTRRPPHTSLPACDSTAVRPASVVSRLTLL